jgi:rhodanese-related sulfurtransferase
MKTIISLFAVLFFSVNFTFGQQVTETEENRIERIAKDEFKENLESNEYIVFDVRTIEEYQAGHIKGSKSLNFLGKTFESTIEQLPKNYKYMIYCQSGGRSAKALEKMKEAGFVHVLELEGGYSKW